MWYVDFAWKLPLNDEKISLTPGQVRGVPEGGCRADVWIAGAVQVGPESTLLRLSARTGEQQQQRS